MQVISNACAHEVFCFVVNMTNSIFLELRIQIPKNLIHKPRACEPYAKVTRGVVIWSR